MINPKDELRKLFEQLLSDLPDDRLEALGSAIGRLEIHTERATQYVSPGAVRMGYTDIEKAELKLFLCVPVRYGVFT